MVNRVSFHGRIETGDIETLTGILRRWLRTAELDFRLRRTGWETVYETGDFYFYCFEGLSYTQPVNFLLEGYETNDKVERMNERLVELMNMCSEESIECCLECVEENEEGVEVSEQMTVEK